MTNETITQPTEYAITGADPGITTSDRDTGILAERIAAFDDEARVRVGDYIEFADGITRRVSHVWETDPWSVQTSDDGSWYLGDGYQSFSGGLYPSIDESTLTRTGDVRPGSVWFFHNDFARAHSAVFANVPCRVWECSGKAPR